MPSIVRYDIEAARLASERAAALVHWKMGRGRAVLAAIASTASLTGMLAGVIGVAKWLQHFPCDECAGGPAEAIVTIPLGLMVAITAMWLHSYLSRRLKAFDTETRVATLELANWLLMLRQRIRE